MQTRPLTHVDAHVRVILNVLVSILVNVLVFSIPTGAAAQERTDTVAPGVVYSAHTRDAGPWRVHVVEVDLRRDDVALVAVRPNDGLFGRERVSAMAARLADSLQVLAGINGDFFDLDTGENENNQVLGGQFLKGMRVTDSPWDTFRNAHTQFAVGADGRPYFERFRFAGRVQRAGPGGRVIDVVLDGLNGIPRDAAGLVLFTEARGAAPRRDTIAGGVEVPLVRIHAGNGTGPRYRVAGGSRAIGTEPIAPGTAVLAAYGPAAAARLDTLLAGTGPLQVRYGMVPDRGPLELVVGGWPRLVVDGRSVAAAADSLEGTFPEFSARRYARSAVAVTRDSATLLLVTVDGVPRGAETGPSAGMTLVEFADLLLSLGAFQALNLDGGGSTTLLVRDRVANAPTDPEGERAVGISLFVVRRQGRDAPDSR